MAVGEEEQRVAISSVRLRNFKAFGDFTLHLRRTNFLVGPNNSGKSTVLGSFRVLAAALRRARAKQPERIRANGERVLGYTLPAAVIPISTDNVQTDLGSDRSLVTFVLTNRNRLHLYFEGPGQCVLVPELVEGGFITGPASFQRRFPISVGVVPVLGPVEAEEVLVAESTIREGLAEYTRRASRHFRSYWYYHADEFEPFRDRVSLTWPSMKVKLPEAGVGSDGKTRLVMFCEEGRMPRELYWAGFGFQVWCQLLTHIEREAGATVLIVDEPEMYLHPEVQRQLVHILREAGPDILVATHSSEVLSEAEPSEVLIIDKTQSRAARVIDQAGFLRAHALLGSAHSVFLTQVARTGRVLFAEDDDDFRWIAAFARRLGRPFLAAWADVALFRTQGFPEAKQLVARVRGMREALSGDLRFAGVFDCDYRSNDEVDAFRTELGGSLEFVHVWRRKEIENFLLEAVVLDRAIERAAADQARRAGASAKEVPPASVLLRDATESRKADILSQFLAHRVPQRPQGGKDAATANRTALVEFEDRWRDPALRLALVPGKDTLGQVIGRLQTEFGLNVTPRQIIQAFQPSEVPQEIQDVVARIDSFRLRRRKEPARGRAL